MRFDGLTCCVATHYKYSMNNGKYIRIAITGDPGSGKSTFARRVAEHTGFRIITTGEMFRTIAADKGVSVTELNQMAESDFDIDKQVDDFLVSLNDVEEDLVLDSRMAWHFVKGALKIRMAVDTDISAQRIYEDSGTFREKYPDLKTATEEIRRRKHSEIDRYKSLYGVDISNPDNFDLILDTSHKSREEIFAEFEAFYNDYEAAFRAEAKAG